MTEDKKYSCKTELWDDILMVITSSIIVITVACVIFRPLIYTIFGIRNKIINDKATSLFLSSAYAVVLPFMSLMLAKAKHYDPEGRAKLILIWLVHIEIIRIRGDPIVDWGLRKSFEQFLRLFWVGYLVYSYSDPWGERAMNIFYVLCTLAVFFEYKKGINFNKAKESYLIGKNPKLIHNYMERIMHEDTLHTFPMNRCDYIVKGEENHELTVCSTGHQLGNAKSTQVMLTIGGVLQENYSQDKADTCIALALAKMLRRRFAKLPVVEVGHRKALDFVLKGLIPYIGSNQDIETERNNFERNPDRLFNIIEDELKYVSEYLHIKVPNYHYFHEFESISMDNLLIGIIFGVLIGVITYDVAYEAYNHCSIGFVKLLAFFDRVITISLFLAYAVANYSGFLILINSKRWSLWQRSYSRSLVFIFFRKLCRCLEWVAKPILSCVKKVLHKLHRCLEWVAKPILSCVKKVLHIPRGRNVRTARVYFSILDVSIPERLPKWIRRNIPRSLSTVVDSTDAKECILWSLEKSGDQLLKQEKETSLKNDGMESLLTNVITSLENNGINDLILAYKSKGSTTEVILVWHIATTLFYHQEPTPPQNNNPNHEPAPHQNNYPFTIEAALELSSYCHYLVKYFPELLPDEVDLTRDMYESVRKDILPIPRSSCQKTKKKHCCNSDQLATCGDGSVIRQGVKLAKDLNDCAEQGKHVWKTLAEFWAEMMLLIAPSDNVEGHEQILERGELITQLWALLTHAGIVTKHKPTRHQYRPNMRTMLGEFWADMMLLFAPSNNIEGHEETLESGDMLITKLRAILSLAGIVTRPEPTNHQYHPSDSRDGAQMVMKLGEFWADMMLLIAPSNNVEGQQENLERGDRLITKLRVLLSHAGMVTRPEPTEL